MGSDHADEIHGYLAALTHDAALADELFVAVISDVAGATDQPHTRRRLWLYRMAWQAFDRRGRPVSPIETTNAVSALRNELDPEEHSILILHLDRGLTFREIADVMALDGTTVARRFEELGRRLRQLAATAGLISA